MFEIEKFNSEIRFRVSPWGAPSFDYMRKRFSGFKGFKGFKGFRGGGAAHKKIEAPRSFETSDFLVSQA